MNPTGDLQAIALDQGTAAKGASSQSRAEAVADDFGSGASAVVAAMGHPAGLLVASSATSRSWPPPTTRPPTI